MRAVPCLIDNATLPPLVSLIGEENVPHPLLREALVTVKVVAAFPGTPFTRELVEAGALHALQVCVWRAGGLAAGSTTVSSATMTVVIHVVGTTGG